MATAIDNLGRKIDSTNMSLGEIKALIGTMMKSKVGAARPVESKKEGEPQGDMGKVRELLEQYTKDFAKDMQEQKGFLSDVVDSLKELVQKRLAKKAESKGQPKKEKKEKPFVSKEEKAMSKSSEGLYKTFAKKGSGYTHDIYVEKAIRDLCSCIKGISPPSTPSPAPDDGGAAGGGGSGGSTGGGGAAPGGGKGGKGGKGGRDKTRTMGGLPIADDLYIVSQFVHQITNEMAMVEKHLLGFNTLGEIFNGVIDKERKIVQEMRSISYEIAGATKESDSLMRSFEDIGSTTKQTGVDRDVFQKSYVKALKHGIKDLKVASNIVKTQLNTERQLGMEAGSLGDEFVSWNKAGRMSVGQLADMGRGMREVARNTGMTGDELATVVKGSKEFIDSLRNAATLSATAAKNVIEIGANAKKLGIESQMQPLLKAMSSSSHLILEASNQTRGFLLSAASSVGRIDELMNGTILRSKAGIKDMAKGMDNMLKRFGVESMDAIDQLSDDAKMRLNIQLKSTFGIELGELRSQYEALNEAGKGMAERLADINKKRQQNLTLEEKATLMEDERRLKTSKNLEVLTALDEAAKGAKDMNQALATFGKRRGEFEADLNALGQTWTSEADVARGAIQSAMDSVNAGLKKAGKQEIKIDSTEIERALKDPAAMRELTSQISKGEQELATAQKSQLDPLTEMQQSLSEINDNIRNYTNKTFSMFFNSLIGKIAVMGAAIAGITGGLALLSMSLLTKLDTFKRVLKEMDVKGGFLEVIKGTLSKKLVPDESGRMPNEKGYIKTEEKSLWGLIKGSLGFRDKEDAAKPPENKMAGNLQPKTEAKPKADSALDKALDSIKKDEDIFPKMLDELKAIHQCVCTDKSKVVSDKAAGQAKAAASPDKSKWAADKAAGQAKAASMSPEQKVQERTARRMQEAETRVQKRDIKLQKNDIKSQKVGDKVQDAQQSLVGRQTKMSAKSDPMPATPSTEGFDIAGMMSSGKEMAKAAVGVAILGLGVVALGAAIVFLASKIMKAFKLDIKTVLETAAVVGAVALAGGAIAAAGFVAFEALNSSKMKGFTEKAKSSYPQVLEAAAALMLIGPAIVLLGAAVVAMTGLILSKLGLSIGSVAEIAGVIVSVAGVAGAMAAGAKAFVQCLDELKTNPTWKKIVDNPGAIAQEVAKAALALVLVGGVIMLLGVALVKMGQIIMSVAGLDASTAVKVAMQVAGLIVAAGAIAGAIIGASFGLEALGKFVERSKGMKDDMIKGAIALLVMAPAITALAAGVVWISQKIMGAFGMDSGTAAKAAMNIGELILAAGFISLAIIGASVGLVALGSLLGSPIAAVAGPLMATGAIALLILAPAIAALAVGVIKITQYVMKKVIDPSEAGKVAEALSDVIGAAAEISLSVIGMGAALAVLGFAVTSGLFWAMVPLAMLGAVALVALTPAVVALSVAIIGMAKILTKGSVGAEEAKATSESLASVLSSAASISWSVIKSATSLGVLGLLAGFSAMAWVITGAMYLGSKALQFLTPAVVHMANTILKIAGDLIDSGVSPAHGKEIVEGLTSILESAGKVSDAITGSVKNLSKLGLLSGYAPYAAILMWNGVSALKVLSWPVRYFVSTIVGISKSIGHSLNPKQASEMANGIANVIASCGAVADQIIGVIPRLSKLGLLSVLAPFVALLMLGGVIALELLSWPVQYFVSTIVGMSKSIGSSLNPKQAAEMANGVANVIASCGAVADQIIGVIPRLSKLGLLSVYAPFVALLMLGGVAALKVLSLPVQSFVSTIVDVAANMKKAIDVGSAKSMIKSLTDVSTIIELVSKVLNTLSEKIVPLTQGGWFSSSPIKQMTKAKGQMEVFFPAMVDLIRTIVDKVRGSMGDTKELKNAAKSLNAMAMILNAAMPSISIMSEKIAPLTQGGFFTASPIDKIKSAIPQFNGFFDSVSDFVNTIVASMTKIKDTTGLKEAAKKMTMLAVVLDSTSKAIGSLASMVGLMDDGFFTKSPITKIIENKTKFADYFGQIADFVKTGIVHPINNVFPDDAQLKNASTIVLALARLLCGTKVTLENLASVIGLMEAKSFWEDAPIEKIIKNKDQFKKWFIAIGEFVNTGIVIPVNDKFKDPSQILAAADIVNAMAKIAANIVPMIKNLAAAIALGTDSSSFFSDSPIAKILKSKDDFSIWFHAIAEFMRDGIVNPVNKEMAGVDISGAAKTITAMANIAANIVPLIKNLSGAMSLMSSPDERFFDTDFPIDKIMVYKDEFALWFKSIAIFMRDGIVNPILEVLPEPRTIMMAAQILSAMSRIVSLIPVVINSMANGLIPLIDSGMSMEDTAKEKLEGKTQLFGDWFRSVAEFMVSGIISPILEVLPEPRTIMMAAQILSAMSRVITMLPTIISNLSALFIPLDAGSCLKSSPIQMLAANTDMFAAWFHSITSFVRDGILYPIMNNLPTAEEITAGMSQMSNMSKGLDAAEQIIAYVSERMNKFSINPFWMMMASWKASMFGYAFMGIANAINNGILQPMKLLPPSSEIDEVVKQLDGMVQALNKVEEVLGAMDIAMKSISNSNIDFSALDKMPIQKMAMFAAAMKDMTATTGNVGMKDMTSATTGVGSAATGAGAGLNPSDKNIETQLLRDQAIAQQTMAKSLSEMVVEALSGDGLFVRDRLNFKAQNDMIEIQRDEAKSTLMPSAAQVAKDSGFEESNKKFNSSQQAQAIKNAQAKNTSFAIHRSIQAKNNPLKPAIQSVNPKPAAGNADMRSAAESMRDTPMQRALGDEARERRRRNPSTDRLKERNEARRIRREQAGFETGGAKMQSQGGSVRGSVGSSRGEAHGQGLMTEQAMAKAMERQAREAQGDQPIGYKLANAASAQQIANQGMMPSIGAPQMGTSETDALSALSRLVNQPTSASGMIAQGPMSVEPMSVAGAGESPASVRPIAQTSPAIPDIQSAIAGDKAATSPTKTEITSPELGTIASEAGDHNAKLDTLITLFQQVLTALKPTSTPITSGGGVKGDTSTHDVVHKPANFFKNPVGLVTQTPGKAILNVGTPKG